jgi:hypothetical protein
VKNRILFVSLAVVLVLSVSITGCTTPSGEQEEEEEFGPGDCIDFEDLPLGTQYHAGDTINTSGVVITVEQFQGFSGYAEVGDQELAGGSGQEMGWIGNVNLRFDFLGLCEVLDILFGAYGGDLYIEINGESATVTNFQNVPDPLGDVHVRVENFGNGKGRLHLSGTINSFAIGGQELAIDHICQPVPGEEPTGICVDFEDLPLAAEYDVGDTFTDSGVVITVEQFQGFSGHAEVGNEGLAGWSGQEMGLINNVNLRFDFGDSSYTGLSLRYGEYGGDINIEINGDFRNTGDLRDIISPVGGVHVSTGNLGNGKGVLVLSGTINRNSLAIGGQELAIDHVCRVYPAEPSSGTYDLTISGLHGDVTTPGQGTFSYAPGTVVDLVAIPHPGYRFSNWRGDMSTVADIYDPITTVTMNGDYFLSADHAVNFCLISAGEWHTVAFRTNYTAIATGYNGDGRCDVGGWTDINLVAAGYQHTVGLMYGGGVIATGDNTHGQCNVDTWTDITWIAAGPMHTVGVKSDGKVIAMGNNDYGQCDVIGPDWTDIVQVAAGVAHTVGLKSDGTVVAAGCAGVTGCDQIDVGTWTDIIQVAAGYAHTVALKSDGTVVAAVFEDMNFGQGDVTGTDWTDIVQLAAGGTLTVGVRKNGTVVATGNNEYGQLDVTGWTDIVCVGAGLDHALGVKSDGSVVAAGRNDYGQCDVTGWMLQTP